MVTYAASSDDAFALNDAVAGVIANAQLRGSALVLRSVMGYKAASSASSQGLRAFESATKFLVGNMLRSITKKLEVEILYGQVGIGVAASVTGAGPYVVTISQAEWADGIWSGGEGMPLEWAATGLAGPVLGTGSITAIDLDARTLTVTLSTGIAPVATDVLFPKGAFGNEFAGIHKILTNTGSLFGISAATYNLWKGNSYNASGALSFNKLQDAIALGVRKGLESDVKVFVNPLVWADLLNDQAALRSYDQSYSPSKAENGAKSITFHGQQGMIEIVPSIYVKIGYAYVLDIGCFAKVGSSDVTFKRPGKEGEFFLDLPSHHGYEIRVYCDMAVFCDKPGHQVLITGITT